MESLSDNITASVNTELPGPLSRALLEKQQQQESTAVTYPKNIPIAIKKAKGAYVEDMDGNVFIDFLTGAGVLCLGHSDERVIQAATEQLAVTTHSLDFPTPVKQQFVETLQSILPKGLKDRMRVHFCGPTGADGVEAAIKIARSHTGRTPVASFHGAYHGSTQMGMAVSGTLGPKKHLPYLSHGVHFFPYPYCFRCPVGMTTDSCEINCLTYLEQVLTDTHSGITRPAAVIIEPVQGEGGSIPAKVDFFVRLREITKELDIPLIVDEVQTGIGRTGSWFAFEQYGIEPDMIVLSKALSGIGQPLSVVLYDRKYQWHTGTHIGTFRGNQVAMASSVRAIQIIREENLLENVNKLSQQATTTLKGTLSKYPQVGDIRGLGLMLGVEIVAPETGKPDGNLARKIQQSCLKNGLIVELGGREDAVIRMLPPLNITEAIMADALERLIQAVRSHVSIDILRTFEAH